MSDELRDECMRSLQCLFIAVDKSIAEAIYGKVRAYIYHSRSENAMLKSEFEAYILSHCCCKWDGDEIISVCDRHAAMTTQFEAAQKEITRLQEVISHRNRAALESECRCQLEEEKLSAASAASGQVISDLQAAYQELQKKYAEEKQQLAKAEQIIQQYIKEHSITGPNGDDCYCSDDGIELCSLCKARNYFASKEPKCQS